MLLSSCRYGFSSFECTVNKAKIVLLSPCRPQRSGVSYPDTVLLLLCPNLSANAYHYTAKVDESLNIQPTCIRF